MTDGKDADDLPKENISIRKRALASCPRQILRNPGGKTTARREKKTSHKETR